MNVNLNPSIAALFHSDDSNYKNIPLADDGNPWYLFDAGYDKAIGNLIAEGDEPLNDDEFVYDSDPGVSFAFKVGPYDVSVVLTRSDLKNALFDIDAYSKQLR